MATRLQTAARAVLTDRHKRRRAIAGIKRAKTLLKRRGWIKHAEASTKGYDLIAALHKARVTRGGIAVVRGQTTVSDLITFNDHPHRRLRDVVDLLDRAVDALQAGPRR